MQNERREAREAETGIPVSVGGGETEVEQVAPPQFAGQLGGARPQTEGFAASTAAVTGKSKTAVNKAIRRATAVCQEARDLIRGTALDTGSDLDSLAKKDLTNEGAKP